VGWASVPLEEYRAAAPADGIIPLRLWAGEPGSDTHAMATHGESASGASAFPPADGIIPTSPFVARSTLGIQPI
jgi:hypothetical protein